MSKSPSPLLGYNTNVRHMGKTYHIQTEDSGFNRPHIITHIFADGGRIVASRKIDYSKFLEADNLEETVRDLMRGQHKDMLVALRNNVYQEDESAHTSSSRSDLGDQVSPATLNISAAQGSNAERAKMPSAPAEGTRSRELSAPDMAAFDKAAEARMQHSSLRSVLLPRARKSQPPRPNASPAVARPKKEVDTRTSKARVVSIFGSDPSNEKSLDDVILNYLVGDDDRKKK